MPGPDSERLACIFSAGRGSWMTREQFFGVFCLFVYRSLLLSYRFCSYITKTKKDKVKE